MSEDAPIPKDPAKRARLASMAGLPTEERAAINQWCYDQQREQARRLAAMCCHCGARILHLPGHSGRYRYTDRFDGTDIYGSGSECAKNERGHEPAQNDSSGGES